MKSKNAFVAKIKRGTKLGEFKMNNFLSILLHVQRKRRRGGYRELGGEIKRYVGGGQI